MNDESNDRTAEKSFEEEGDDDLRRRRRRQQQRAAWKAKFKLVRRVAIDSYLSRVELEKVREEYERVRERHRALSPSVDDDNDDDNIDAWIVRENGCVLSSFVCDCAFYDECKNTDDGRKNSWTTTTKTKKKKETKEEKARGATVAHETWNHRECAKYSRGSIFGKEVSELATTGKIGNMAAFLLRAIAEEEDEEEVNGGDEEEEEVKTKTLMNSTQKRIRVDGDACRKDRDGVYVFNDQYIVKPPHVSGVEFPWHRDGQYEMWKTPDQSVPLPYLSAWVALDDVSEDNGALRFKKNEKERFGPDVDVASIRDEEDDNIATMNAGSVVFFMSDVLHASGKNMSEETRRAWMPQYSLGLPKEEDDNSRNSDSFRCLRTALSGV
jgi:hypothetical protein